VLLARLDRSTEQEARTLSATDSPRDIVQRKVWTPVDRVTAPLASSRACLVVVGLYAGWTAHTTRLNYTPDELRTRDICVVALLAAAIIGTGHLFRPPNRVTMGVFGLLLMINSALRMFGFGLPAWQRSDHTGNWFRDGLSFVEQSNAVPVWGIIGYLGFLIWRRRNNVLVSVVGGARGARDAP
jgi:hypothetical protein